MLSRSSKAKGQSIERVFKSVFDVLEHSIAIQRLEVPVSRANPGAVIANILYCLARASNALHITGDVHYVAAAGLFGHKTVLTVHDNRLLSSSGGAKSYYHRWLWYKVPIRTVDSWTAISTKTADELVRVGVDYRKIDVIPDPVPQSIEYTSYPAWCEKPIILHIGTAPNKNLLRVLEALRGMTCTLLIVGALTDEHSKCLSEYKIDFENYVRVSDATISSLYKRAHIVSFPSLYEGFGMPVAEANAAGRPVLTSRLAPMTETAGEGAALMIDPRDVSSIKEGFRRLLNDQALRESLVNKGLENAQRYSALRVASAYRQVYSRVFGL